MSKYIQRANGEPITVKYYQNKKQNKVHHQIMCCDCGLVHDLIIIPRKTRLSMLFWRNEKSTSNVRRRKAGFVCEKQK